jgi:hypothetical protein
MFTVPSLFDASALSGTDVSANIMGGVPVTAFASTRSCDEIQRESEQDRRRRGWRVGLVAVLAITLVAHTAAVALDTSAASAATVVTRVRGMCWSTATAAQL